MAIRPLPVKSLCAKCDPKQLAFATTAKLPVLAKPIGQGRALAAIDFGLNIQQDRYNLYLMGPSGSGKHHVIRSILTQKAESEQAPEDWCYVNNFSDAHQPLAICLPTGLGPVFRKDMDDLIDQLQTEIPQVQAFIENLQKKYQTLKAVVDYLNAVELDIIENVQDFYRVNEKINSRADFFRYRVNVLVSNQNNHGIPIVFEDNPTHTNLLGRLEYTVEWGVLSTNFTLIRAGALHRANGGYLILPADHLIMKPGAWDALKRALYAKCITLESLGQVLGFPNTVTLEPEPIPLKLKIILIGERSLYYLLCEHDSSFSDLFKVSVDFANHIPRNTKGYDLFARLVATINQDYQLKPLNRLAVAKLIDHSSRLANDAKRLYTHTRSLIELLQEANYWAQQDSQPIVKVAHIQKAIDQKIYRMNRVETRIHEDIERDILLLDTRGKAVGQCNGLSVMQLGHYAFSVPSRITATARLGKGEVIDIEREVDLGGAIHSKGVLILSGFLNGYYLLNRHLSISASLVFEQNYGEVEGDSASVAELAALLSAIAHLPIKQSLAMTGAINQHGIVQSIGGVNEKIEGFFKVCKRAGLDGTQGVLIPASNVQHLMLHDDVIQAVKKKTFFIYSVKTIDEVMHLLTGIEAGQRNKEGKFPGKSVNGRIEASLLKYAIYADGEHKSN